MKNNLVNTVCKKVYNRCRKQEQNVAKRTKKLQDISSIKQNSAYKSQKINDIIQHIEQNMKIKREERKNFRRLYV